MKKQKQHSQQKKLVQHKNQCCYFISLKPPIYKTPLYKYDFKNYDSNIPHSEISQYFNYGFDSESMIIYNKLTNKFVNRENSRKQQLSYDYLDWNLLKLNDSIPIDLGGFGPILDKKGIQMDLIQYFDEDLMMKELVYRCMHLTILNQRQTITQNYGIIQFIHSMYRQFPDQQNNLTYFFNKLQKYLDQKYNETISEEREKMFHEIVKKQKEQIQSVESNKEEQNIYDYIFQKIHHSNQQHQTISRKNDDYADKNKQKYYQHNHQHLIDFSSSDSQSVKKRKSQKQKKEHRHKKYHSHNIDSDRERERKHRHKHFSRNKKLTKHKHHHKTYKRDEERSRKHTK